MEKRVMVEIALVVIVVLALGGGYYLFTRSPPPVHVGEVGPVPAPLKASAVYNSCVGEGEALAALITAVAAKDASRCPDFFDVTVLCKAALGVPDACSSESAGVLPERCDAVLTKNPSKCQDDGTCLALAGGACPAGDAACDAIKSGNTGYFLDSAACEEIPQKLSQ